jgi:D-glycero-D-manno-heptose 1,7-bisphosphate phosphatase
MAKEVKQAVILAGGLGTRMRPLTLTTPKPMVLVNGKPFLEYIVELLKNNGIEEIVILLGYLPEKVIEHFGDGKKFGLNIKYSISPVGDETGTRIKKAEKLLHDNFILLYCDNYWPLQLNKLIEFYNEQNVLASLLVYSNKLGITKNNIYVDEAGYVMSYDKSRQDPNLNGVDIGFMILDKKVLELAPKGDFSFEKEIFPRLIAQKQLAGYLTNHRHYSLGSIERLPIIEEFFRIKKIVFLDRDGVINKKPPKADYVKKWKDFQFLPGAIEGMKLLSQKGFEIYIITNQPGIARGMMTEEDLETIHSNLVLEAEKNGVSIKEIYVCKHGWDEGCDCRKPKPGMLFRAANEHYFNVTETIFIGDDERDEEAGRAAECRTILMEPDGNLFEVLKEAF